MKKFSVVVAITVITLVAASAASAASTARDPRVPALQRQVAALTTELRHEEDLADCRFVYQSHFNYVQLNLWAILIGQPQVPDQTGSDNGACSRVGITPPSRRALQSTGGGLLGASAALLVAIL